MHLNHCFCILSILKIIKNLLFFLIYQSENQKFDLCRNNCNWNFASFLLLQILENKLHHPSNDANNNANALRVNANWK